MSTRTDYYYTPPPSIFNKLAGFFDRALDLESVIDHPTPYPRRTRRKSCRQLRDSHSPERTMSSSQYYPTRPLAPYAYTIAPSPASYYGPSTYGSPPSPYQAYHTPLSSSTPRAPPQPPIEYCCLMPNCEYAAARKADLDRHYRAMHSAPSTVDMYDCQVSGCHRKGNYGFKRKDKMVDHMREVHKVDIPKRSSTSGGGGAGAGRGGVATRVVYPDYAADRYYAR